MINITEALQRLVENFAIHLRQFGIFGLSGSVQFLCRQLLPGL